MKLLFLDFDGVLNIIKGENPTYLKEFHFEPKLVDNLNKLLDSIPDLKIVVSSSWREDLEDAIEQLKLSGFKYEDRIIGVTSDLGHRGKEISNSLDHLEYSKYLVIDDNINEIKELIPYDRILRIDPSHGFDSLYLDFALNYFNA